MLWEPKASSGIEDPLKKTGAPSVSVVIIEDGVHLTGPVADQLARLVFLPGLPPESKAETARVRAVLEGLVRGKIEDRRPFPKSCAKGALTLSISASACFRQLRMPGLITAEEPTS